MANYIDDLVIKTIVEMMHEHLIENQDEIDTLYGDESDERNQKVSINLKINLSAKGKAVEAKSTINYVLVPSTPAEKRKTSKKRFIDKTQPDLPFGDSSDDDEPL